MIASKVGLAVHHVMIVTLEQTILATKENHNVMLSLEPGLSMHASEAVGIYHHRKAFVHFICESKGKVRVIYVY